jgi:hypothetical protein
MKIIVNDFSQEKGGDVNVACQPTHFLPPGSEVKRFGYFRDVCGECGRAALPSVVRPQTLPKRLFLLWTMGLCPFYEIFGASRKKKIFDRGEFPPVPPEIIK